MSRIVLSEPRQASTPTMPGLRPYLITLIACWLALTIAAFTFARQEHAPWIRSAALPAFLIESVFYLGALLRAHVHGSRNNSGHGHMALSFGRADFCHTWCLA